MTRQVITFANQKGGAGKSTACCSIASWLHLNGHKVAIIDADPQQSIVAWYEWGEGAGQSSLAGIEIVCISHKGEFEEALQVIDQEVDFVLIDSPGRDHAVVHAAISLADLVIIPAKPTALDIRASAPTVRQAIQEGKRAYYLISQAKNGSTSILEAQEAFKEADLPALNAFLPDILAFPRSMAAGETPYSENRYSPGGIAIDKAAREIMEVINGN